MIDWYDDLMNVPKDANDKSKEPDWYDSIMQEKPIVPTSVPTVPGEPLPSYGRRMELAQQKVPEADMKDDQKILKESMREPLKSLTETATHLGVGVVAYIPSIAAGAGQMVGDYMRKGLSYLADREFPGDKYALEQKLKAAKTPKELLKIQEIEEYKQIRNQMILERHRKSPEQIRASAEEAAGLMADWITGWMKEPETEQADANLKLAHVILDDLLLYYPHQLDKKLTTLGFPNFGWLVGVAGELTMFKALHSSVKEAKTTVKDYMKFMDNLDLNIPKDGSLRGDTAVGMKKTLDEYFNEMGLDEKVTPESLQEYLNKTYDKPSGDELKSPTKSQKINAHKIAQAAGLDETARRDLAEQITGVRTMMKMNKESARRFIEALKKGKPETLKKPSPLVDKKLMVETDKVMKEAKEEQIRLQNIEKDRLEAEKGETSEGEKKPVEEKPAETPVEPEVKIVESESDIYHRSEKPTLTPELAERVTYNGVQQDASFKPAYHTYTDKTSGSTFIVPFGEDLNTGVAKRLKKLDEAFQKPVPKAEARKEPVMSPDIKKLYDEVMLELPEHIRKDISIENIKTGRFPAEHEGEGGRTLISGKLTEPEKYSIVLEKGGKDLKSILRHEMLHTYVLKHPELLKTKEGMFSHEKAVDLLEAEVIKAKPQPVAKKAGEGKELPTGRSLWPANRVEGKLYIGKPGDLHAEIGIKSGHLPKKSIDDFDIEKRNPNIEAGWINKDGKFLTTDEADAYIKKGETVEKPLKEPISPAVKQLISDGINTAQDMGIYGEVRDMLGQKLKVGQIMKEIKSKPYYAEDMKDFGYKLTDIYDAVRAIKAEMGDTDIVSKMESKIKKQKEVVKKIEDRSETFLEDKSEPAMPADIQRVDPETGRPAGVKEDLTPAPKRIDDVLERWLNEKSPITKEDGTIAKSKFIAIRRANELRMRGDIVKNPDGEGWLVKSTKEQRKKSAKEEHEKWEDILKEEELGDIETGLGERADVDVDTVFDPFGSEKGAINLDFLKSIKDIIFDKKIKAYRGTTDPWNAKKGYSESTEGIGLYVSKDIDFARFFGKVKKVVYNKPKKPLKMDYDKSQLPAQDPYMMLKPIKDTDSSWIKLNKEAIKNLINDGVLTKKTWDGEIQLDGYESKIHTEITKLLRRDGYDAVDVYSKAWDASWTVILDEKLINREATEIKIDPLGFLRNEKGAITFQLNKTAKLTKKSWEEIRRVEISLRDDIKSWLMDKTKTMPRPPKLYRGVPKGTSLIPKETDYIHGTPWAFKAARGGKGVFGDPRTTDVYEIPVRDDAIYYRGGSLSGDPLEATRIPSIKGMTWDRIMESGKELYYKDLTKIRSEDKKTNYKLNEVDEEYAAEKVIDDIANASFEIDLLDRKGIWRDKSIQSEINIERPRLRSYSDLRNDVEVKRKQGYPDEDIPELDILRRSESYLVKLLKSEKGAITFDPETVKKVKDLVKKGMYSRTDIVEGLLGRGASINDIKKVFPEISVQIPDKDVKQTKAEWLKPGQDPKEKLPGRVVGKSKTGNQLRAPGVTREDADMIANVTDLPSDTGAGLRKAKIGEKVRIATSEGIFTQLGKPIREAFWRTMIDDQKKSSDFAKVYLKKSVKLRKNFSFGSRELHEQRVNIYEIAQQENGIERLKLQGITKIPKLTPKEKLVYEGRQKLYKELFPLINEARVKVGQDPFAAVDNYSMWAHDMAKLADFEHLSIFDGLDKIQGGLDRIRDIPSQLDKLGRTLSFKGHEKLRAGPDMPGYLILDSFENFNIYAKLAAEVINKGPDIAYLHELLNNYDLSKNAPNTHKFLSGWLDYQKGHEPVLFVDNPKARRALRGLASNVATAFMTYAVRPTLVQLASLNLSWGYLGTRFMAEGIAKFFSPFELIRAHRESSMLSIRTPEDIFLASQRQYPYLSSLPGKNKYVSKLKELTSGPKMKGFARSISNIRQTGYKGIGLSDSIVAYITYLGGEAKGKYLYKKLSPESQSKISIEKFSKQYGDDAVVRCQGSADTASKSPMQRHAEGKFVTTLGTFTIANFDFISRHLMGINNPDITKPQALAAAARTVIASVLITSIFEDYLGIRSPIPTPAKAYQKLLEEDKTMGEAVKGAAKELLEFIPIFGSKYKFDSELLGPVVQQLVILGQGDFSAVGRLGGMPGFQQLWKAYRAEKAGGTAIDMILGRYIEPPKKRSITGSLGGSDKIKDVIKPVR